MRQRTQKYTPFLVGALFAVLILGIIYPYYQYYIDPDGTSYLTISKWYASGEYSKAINGYWSPWACWLTAVLIKQHIAAIPASVIVNAVGGLGFLFISQSFFLLLGVNRTFQWVFNLTLAAFLPYAVFWQSFDDLWECFFLLASLRVMLTNEYKSSALLWLLNGFIGALAYFAKAYSFPFFILNTFCCGFFLVKAQERKNRLRWVVMSIVPVVVMLICSSPWIYLLHQKYGLWTTSTAGSLNMSWYLVGHQFWKADIAYLVPPPYADAPYYWVDPYLTNGNTPHFWNSFYLFGLQLARIVYNTLKFIGSMLQLSVFFPFIFIRALLIVFSQKARVYLTTKTTVATLSFLLFPLAYFLINFESRYIWYMLPIGMAIGALAIQHYNLSAKRLRLVIVLTVISFLLFPAFKYVYMFNEGRAEYELANKLRSADVKGGFTANMTPRKVGRLAYFSDNPFYVQAKAEQSYDTIVKDMRLHQVPYYLYFYDSVKNRLFRLKDEQGPIEPYIDSIPGVLVFRVIR